MSDKFLSQYTGNQIEEMLSSKYIEIGWDDLLILRDNNQLVPGCWYRLIDYRCTTAQENTISVENQFDILILAISTNTLSEECRAIHHKGDDYFKNNNLSAWKIWYCLDNDSSRFGWATVDGTGVIYRMIDEFGNDCPYDFKCIWFLDNEGNWCYTFQNKNESIPSDISLNNYDFSNTNGYVIDRCQNNIIKPLFGTISIDDKLFSTVQLLNKNILFGEAIDNLPLFLSQNNYFGYDCYENILLSGCKNNKFGNGCFAIVFNGNACCNNVLGNGCCYITFADCYNNTFGIDCYGITFDTYCQNITFGNDCHDITFSYSCYNMTLGNNCCYITTNDLCFDMTFGNNCSDITFGSSCYCMTFGDYCMGISFGMNCQNITFGIDCRNITFGYYDKALSEYILLENYQYIIIENGVSYITFGGSTQHSDYIKNHRICMGTSGTDENNLLEIAPNIYNQNYPVRVFFDKNGVLNFVDSI